MAISLLALGAVMFAAGVVALMVAEPVATRLATARNRPKLMPVAQGGTGHDRMENIIQSQTNARRQRMAFVRSLRRIAMAVTLIAVFPIVAGLILLISA